MVCKFICLLAAFSSLTFTEVMTETKEVMELTSSEVQYNYNSDGFFYKGTIILTRVVSGQRETFYLFNRKGVDYVAKSKHGPYYRLSRRMTINYIDYKL